MLALLLRIFAVVVFVLLAAAWLIDSNELRWAFGASAAFVASFVVPDVVVNRKGE